MQFLTAGKHQTPCQRGHTYQQKHINEYSVTHPVWGSIKVASAQGSRMWFPQFTGVHVSSWLGRDTQLRVILIMSRSFGLRGVKSKAQACQHRPPHCRAVVPTEPSTLDSQLCFHSNCTHPQARQHKRSLCFAFSLHSPQTGMFERQAAVVGRGPSTAAGLLSQQSRNSARGLIRCQVGH